MSARRQPIYVVGSGDRADDKVRINWDLCTNCGKCVPVCPTNGSTCFGQEMTADEVLDEVEQDSTFYANPAAAMTVSGGECQLQPDFMAALLAGAYERGINTPSRRREMLPWISWPRSCLMSIPCSTTSS